MAKKQENYEELKKKSEETETFIRIVDEFELNYKKVPPTKKGLEREVAKLKKKLNKKLKK